MSLITTASSWENTPMIPKQKISNIRKQLNNGYGKKSGIEGFTSSHSGSSPYIGGVGGGASIPTTIGTSSSIGDNTNVGAGTGGTDKRKHIQTLIEKMTGGDENNAGEDLVNFKPLSSGGGIPKYPENEFVPQSVPVVNHNGSLGTSTENVKYYTPTNQRNLGGNQTNYSTAYQQRIPTPATLVSSGNGTTPPPYYSAYGIGKTGENGISNEKLMESIRYIVHLLEEQQMEKTNYVMEEFIMYSFLGVFMIYVCDTFSTAGKYIR